MRWLKAIFVGCLFIIITILVLQLIYIFVAVAYNSLAQTYPFLNEIVGIFRYLVGIPIFIVTMFVGGYLTAYTAAMTTRKNILLVCMSVGLISSGGMIYPTLDNSALTTTGIIIIILAILATVSGGLYWEKGEKLSD